MNFHDIGIIIGKRILKENSSIISVFTAAHGLYSGVVRESSKKFGSVYQEGNIVDFFWQARLHEHIGTARCELIKSSYGALITNRTKLYAFNAIISLIKLAFHEREPHNNFFPVLQKYLNELQTAFDFQAYIKLELAILAESGYKLELGSCAVTGSSEDLVYLSPKSGKAVCGGAGLPYADRLLPLPKFLTSLVTQIIALDRKQALDLTTYFFSRYLFCNGRPPESRQVLIELLLK